MKLPSTVFDLHCDTLTAFMDDSPQQHGDTLNDPCHQFALCKIPRGVRFWSWGRKIAWRLALTLTGRTCPPVWMSRRRSLIWGTTSKAGASPQPWRKKSCGATPWSFSKPI